MPSPVEILHYKMNDDAATTNVVDSSSGGNDGTLTGNGNTADATVAGKINSALAFDGVNDYILRSDFTDLGTNVDKTVCFWMYKVATPNNFDRYFTKHRSSTALAYMFVSSNSSVDGFVFNDGTEIRFPFTAQSTGAWHHYVVLYDESAGAISKVWIDGVDTSSSGSFATGWGFEANDNLNIGGRAGTGQFPPCQYDDFRIYNAALTADQVALIWNSGNGTELTLAELEGGGSTKGGLCLLGVGL